MSALIERNYLLERIGSGAGSDPDRPAFPAGVDTAEIQGIYLDAGNNQILAIIKAPAEVHSQLIDAGTASGKTAWAVQTLEVRKKSAGGVRTFVTAVGPSGGGRSPH